MNRRIRNIMLKEWELAAHDLNSLMMISLLPLLILAQSTAMIWLVQRFAGESILSTEFFVRALSQLQSAVPAIQGLNGMEQLQVFLLDQMMFYLLLIPTMIAINFATFSIIDEKTSGSLEALLATPVRTWELLLGKALAGAIPAVVVTWICGLIFVIVIGFLGWGSLIALVLTPSWYVMLLLLTPLTAILSFLLGLIGSARAKDVKAAQNLSLLIIFPVFGLIALQVSGLLWFNPLATLGLAAAFAAIDAAVLRLAVRLFQRESIVINWR